MSVYGAAALRLPWPETTDGYIPWPRFWAWYGRIPAIQAFQRVNQTLAVGAAVALAMGGADDVLTRDLAVAYPED